MAAMPVEAEATLGGVAATQADIAAFGLEEGQGGHRGTRETGSFVLLRYLRTMEEGVDVKAKRDDEERYAQREGHQRPRAVQLRSPVSWLTILTVTVVIGSKGLSWMRAATPAASTTIMVSPTARDAVISKARCPQRGRQDNRA